MRTAVVGLGRMGLRHLQVANAKRLEIVGICDTAPEALRIAGEEHGIAPARRFTDAAALLERERPELVVIATHATSHADLTCCAAEFGATRILCEKPLAVSLSACDAMIDACRAAGAKLAVNHQMRYMEQYTLVKQMSAKFGGLRSATFVAGNFGLAMNGTHYVEAFRYLTDDLPNEVTAWLTKQSLPNPRGSQFHDRAGSIRLTTVSGKRMTLECGDDLGHGVQAVYAGRNGTVYVDELSGLLRCSVRKPEHFEVSTTRYGMPADETTHKIAPTDALAPTRSLLEDFLADGDYPTGEQGRDAAAAIVAAHVSHENGNVAVRIDDGLPRDRRFPWA